MTTHERALSQHPGGDRRAVLTMGAGRAAARDASACRVARELAVRPEPLAEDERRRLDELFGDLAGAAGSVAPISHEERAARRMRLGELVGRSGFDAILQESPGSPA